MNSTARAELFFLARALVVGTAVVAAAGLVGRAIVDSFRIHHQEKRITVTGSATRRIRSDSIVWEASVRSQDPSMTVAYKKLASDMPVLVQFVEGHGVPDAEIATSSTSVSEVHPRDQNGVFQEQVTASYIVEQHLTVTSKDIPKVEKVSREVTDLLDRGIYVHSEAPLYIYTNLAALKIQMLADASRDARQCADQIATNTGATLGGLLAAKMGVLQINPAFSTEVSAEGNNDKTTLDKDVLGVVTASFAIR
ncbi:MAG TPA: SIMPL domain-containing protein [Polyangiaceae bacterium]|nr:SIMPL domain-containing protein [Polyangiaceae bacterium]